MHARLGRLHILNSFSLNWIKANFFLWTNPDLFTVIFEANMEHLAENDSRGALISATCVLNIKWHDFTIEVAYRSPKSGIPNIIRIYLNLIVATKTIHVREH